MGPFSRSGLCFFFVILVLLINFGNAQADPPVKFKLNGSFITPGSWSTPRGGTGWSGLESGSSTDTSISLHTEATSDASGSGIHTINQTTEVWVLESATAHVAITEGGSVTGNHANSRATYGDFLTGGSATISAIGIDADSYSGGDPSFLSTAGCTASGYRRLAIGSPVTLHASVTSRDADARGDLTLAVTIGGETPVALSDDPGSVLAGTSLTINNLSYDPDNEAGTSGRPGICSAAWTLTKPDGTQSTGSSLASFIFTPATVGHYSLLLHVIDDDGEEAETTIEIDARIPQAYGGRSDHTDECKNCGDAKGIACVQLPAGNASFGSTDPTYTRGFPIRNRIFVNSQSFFPSRTTAMGNASFSYGINVYTATVGSTSKRFLIDENGMELEFGAASGSPTAQAGVFSSLAIITGGYRLSNAGEPGNIWQAGNYTYDFDSSGKLTQVTDPSGNIQTVSYNGSGDPYQVSDSGSGRVLTFEYDTPGTIARVVEGAGLATTHLSYTSGRLSGIVLKNSSGTTIRQFALTYDSNGLISTVTRDGDSSSTITFTHSGTGSGPKLANMSWSGGATNYVYFVPPHSDSAYRVSRTNTDGGVIRRDYLAGGDIRRLIIPVLSGASSDTVYTFGHDSNHNRTTESNGLNTTTIGYNSLGLVTSYADSFGGSWTYGYSGRDLTSVADTTGTIWTLAYTDSSNPHSVTTLTNALSKTWSFTYNSHGQLLTATPPTGSPSSADTYAYEESTSSGNYGYLKQHTNGAGNIVTYNSYTARGDLTSLSTYPASGVTNTHQFAYDAAQRLTLYTHPDSKTLGFTYTGRDLTGTTDEASTTNTLGYCAVCGQLTSWSGPLSKALAWTLDGDHKLTAFSDGNTHSTSYDYGDAGDLKEWSYPDSQKIQFEYDDYGRFAKYIANRSGTSITASYDAADRISGLSLLPSGNPSISYTYNTDGTLGSMSDAAGTTTYTYYANKLVHTVVYDYSTNGLTNSQTLTYTYHPDDSLASLEWKDGSSVVASWDYSYDGAGRLNSLSNSFGDSATYVYDGEGKITRVQNSSGMEIGYTYNQARGWPTEISCQECIPMDAAMAQPGGFEEMDSPGGPPWAEAICSAPFAKWTLTYDGGSNTVGNLTKSAESSFNYTDYQYDALYRLTSEVRTGTGAYTETHGYDLAGNVTTLNGSTFATYDSANKFSTISGGSVTQDGDGNITDISANGMTYSSGSFDPRNKLSQVTVSSTAYNYKTDGNDRRVFRQVGSSGTKTFYIFSGDQLIGEITGSTPSVAYSWGPDGVASERLLTGTPKSLFYCYGPQGETRNLTDSSVTVVDTYLYNAYGKLLSSTGTDPNPFRYGGKFGYYTDPNTGLQLAGARWYSPNAFRWLGRDPIHYKGGDNLNSYVGGNPVRFVDPSGLEANVNYSTLDEAGGQALLDAQSPTVKNGWEYGGMICKPWFRNCYYYTPPRTDRNESEVLFGACGPFSKDAATYHSHGESRKPGFSSYDTQEAAKGKIPWFLIGKDNKRKKLLPDGTVINLDKTP